MKIRYQKIEQDPSYPARINACIGDINRFFKANNVSDEEKVFTSIKQVNKEYFPDEISAATPQFNQEKK